MRIMKCTFNKRGRLKVPQLIRIDHGDPDHPMSANSTLSGKENLSGRRVGHPNTIGTQNFNK